MDETETQIKPGIVPDMPASAYHSVQAVSASSLMNLKRLGSPAHVKACRGEQTDAMEFGSAMHCLVLEHDKFNERYYERRVLEGIKTKNGKAAAKPELTEEGKALLQQDAFENQGKIEILPKDRYTMGTIAAYVQAHPVAGPFVQDSQHEISLFWEDTFDGETVLCKCRMDMLSKDNQIIGDLKFVSRPAKANPEIFPRSILPTRDGWNYWIQAAWYARGAWALGLPVKEFWFLPVETDEPYGISCHVLEESELRGQQVNIEPLARTWAECLRTDIYPSYNCMKNIITIGDE